MKHPMDMGGNEVMAFLPYLTNERQVNVSTHEQALCALLFLYQQVLGSEFLRMEDVYCPSRLPRLLTVLTQWEVFAVLAEMKGTHALMARLTWDAKKMTTVEAEIQGNSKVCAVVVASDGRSQYD